MSSYIPERSWLNILFLYSKLSLAFPVGIIIFIFYIGHTDPTGTIGLLIKSYNHKVSESSALLKYLYLLFSTSLNLLILWKCIKGLYKFAKALTLKLSFPSYPPELERNIAFLLHILVALSITLLPYALILFFTYLIHSKVPFDFSHDFWYILRTATIAYSIVWLTLLTLAFIFDTKSRQKVIG